MPAQIVLFRHAEKPSDDKAADLSNRGRFRAAALAVYLPAAFGRFDRLFAAADSKESRRSRETITPLVEALRLAVDCSFENEQFEALAFHLLSTPELDQASVAVCWHHGTIPALARALGVHGPPDRWADDVFDRVWRLVPDSRQMVLTRVRQRLMFGDSVR